MNILIQIEIGIRLIPFVPPTHHHQCNAQLIGESVVTPVIIFVIELTLIVVYRVNISVQVVIRHRDGVVLYSGP